MLTPRTTRKTGTEINVERRRPTANLFSSQLLLPLETGIWVKPGSGRSLLLSINTLLPLGAMVVIFREGTEWMLRGKSNLEDDKKSEVDVLRTIFAVVVEVTRRRMLLLGVAECQD